MQKVVLVILSVVLLTALGLSAWACEDPPGGGDEVPPPSSITVSITSPADGSTVSGTTTISVSVTSTTDITVTSVELYIDDTLTTTMTASPYDYSWDTTAAAEGDHTMYAKANIEGMEPVTSSLVNVTVQNQAGGSSSSNEPPVVKIN
jgi:hypothetical protein